MWSQRFTALLSMSLLIGALSAAAPAQTIPTAAQLSQDAATEDAAPGAGAKKTVGQWMQSIEADLIAEKFDDLDAMADKYRRNKARLHGGDWRLRAFYSALDAPQKTDRDTADHLDHLRHWMELRPESITARVALATSLHTWAWVARGNGLARTVTPEGGQLFHQRIAEAQAVLEGSRDMNTMCPQWFSAEMVVGLAEGWDDHRMQELFDRAVQFEPDYQYFYLARANYLQPKWYGAPGAVTEFAKTSADHLGGESGDMIYFDIAAVILKRGNGDLNSFLKTMDWQRIQNGYQALSSQYGSSRKIRNQFAFMAYQYRDAAVARQQLAAIGDDWTAGVWGSRQIFDRARDWAQNRTSWP